MTNTIYDLYVMQVIHRHIYRQTHICMKLKLKYLWLNFLTSPLFHPDLSWIWCGANICTSWCSRKKILFDKFFLKELHLFEPRKNKKVTMWFYTQPSVPFNSNPGERWYFIPLVLCSFMYFSIFFPNNNFKKYKKARK